MVRVKDGSQNSRNVCAVVLMSLASVVVLAAGSTSTSITLICVISKP